jgi:transposase
MEQRDFRGLGRPAQEALRARAIYLVTQAGRSQWEAAEAVGVSRQTVNQWVRRYGAVGAEGLLDGRRLSSRQRRGALSPAEARRIAGWLRNKCPDQLGLPYMLWTASVVRELIRRRLGKRLGLSTVQLYLQRWQFTPQKPLSRATQRSEPAIAAWLKQDYPRIARRAKRHKAMLYWGDETGLSNQDQIGRGYAPKGQTPVVHKTAKKVTTGLISAVNNRGLMRFLCYHGALNTMLFINFLHRLIASHTGKVILIVDNLRVHHAARVKQWVRAHRDRIELHFLPAYAPDRNPDEYLNQDLKQAMKNQPKPDSREDLVQQVSSVMHSLQRRPARIRAYFHARDVRYAA